MLEMRPSCEHCQKALPNDSDMAMICTFECTFCATCVTDVLQNVCPNCGGGFEKRPTRPAHHLDQNPVSKHPVHKEIDMKKLEALQTKFKSIDPRKR